MSSLLYLLTVFIIIEISYQSGCDLQGPVESTRVVSPEPYTYLKPTDIPANFTWTDIDGKCLVTGVRNQYVPRTCGACWAFATTGALSDRFKIAVDASVPDITLSPQIMMNLDAYAGTCFGGDKTKAYEFVYHHGISDEDCMPYEGVDKSRWGEYPVKERFCYNCDRFGNCSFVPGYKYKVTEYGAINTTGVDMTFHMQSEIFERGPIACSIYGDADSFINYKGGIITDDTQYVNTTWVVAIVGWGQELNEDGVMVDYWIGRNQVGTTWGENGFFRLIKGVDAFNLETSSCTWAVPNKKTVEDILNNNLKVNDFM